MNKKQQIEEMAKKMPEKIKDPLDNSRYIIFGKSLRREIARNITTQAIAKSMRIVM